MVCVCVCVYNSQCQQVCFLIDNLVSWLAKKFIACNIIPCTSLNRAGQTLSLKPLVMILVCPEAVSVSVSCKRLQYIIVSDFKHNGTAPKACVNPFHGPNRWCTLIRVE